MASHRQALRIVGLTLALAAAFALFVWIVPWQAELAETNFQANLIRLQAFLFDGPHQSALLGSSLSGRLLPAYFKGTSLAPLANLGLDGSSALLGLDLALTNPPPLVLVEVNTLLKPYDANDELLAKTLHGFMFQVAGKVGLFRAENRPSSMLYSWLKTRRTQGRVAPTGPRPQASAAPSSEHPETPALDPEVEATKANLRARIAALKARGTRIVLVQIPTGARFNSANNPSVAFADELAHEFHLLQVDLDAECASRGKVLSFTDGIHLAPAAARETSQLLAQLLPKSASASVKVGSAR